MSEIEAFVDFAEALAERTGDLVRAAWQGAEAVSYKAGSLGCGRAVRSWPRPHLGALDGTRQFGMGLLNHACIALCRDDQPILGLIDLPLVRMRAVGVAGQGTVFAGKPVRVSDAQDLAVARLGPSAIARLLVGVEQERVWSRTRDIFDMFSDHMGDAGLGASACRADPRYLRHVQRSHG